MSRSSSMISACPRGPSFLTACAWSTMCRKVIRSRSVDIGDGEAIRRYGEIIGLARGADRPRGMGRGITHFRCHDPPALAALDLATAVPAPLPPLEGYTFEGYRNPDGTVGTKNILAISTSVQCVAGTLEFAVKRIRAELLPKYPNVDAVIALTHAYGCGVAISRPMAAVPIRTLQNLAQNPNFGGEVMVVGLGCEKLVARTTGSGRRVRQHRADAG